MNKLITNKITLSIFFVIACQFTVKAQDTAKRVIVIVRPGGATGVTSITTTTTIPVATTPAVTPASTVTPGRYASAPAQKATPYMAPNSRPHTYTAPSTSERVSASSYMHKPVAPATVAVATSAVTPGPGSASNAGTAKYAVAATAAPVSTKPAVTPPATDKKDTIVVTKTQKDTLVVTKVQKDSIDSVPPKHAGNKIAFAELGGPGLAISLNYDMRFSKGSKDGFGFRIGAGYFAAGNNTVFTAPFQVNYLYGKNGMYLELGVGTTFLNSKGDNYSSKTWEFDKVTGFIGTAVIGVRYEPDKALNFRLGYVPILYDEGLINAGGFSIGYTF